MGKKVRINYRIWIGYKKNSFMSHHWDIKPSFFQGLWSENVYVCVF